MPIIGGGVQQISVLEGAVGGIVRFQSSPTVTFGISGQVVTASAAGGGTGAGGSVNFSAGAASADLASVVFANAGGISFGLNGATITGTVQTNYLTTAMQSNAVTLSNIRLSAGAASANLSAVTFANSNGISFGLNGSVVTGTVQTNYLTTAMLSNAGSNFVQAGAAFVGTSASGTIASNGISISIGPYLTTAAASNHSHGNPTLALTNLSGTTASASNGLTLSLSAAAPGAGAVNFSAGAASANLASVVFSNSNGVSFGLNGSTITGSVNAGGGGATLSGSHPYANNLQVVNAWAQGSLFLNQWNPGAAVQFDNFVMPISHSNATNSSGSATLSYWFGFYTRNASSLSRFASSSFSVAITASGTVGNYSLKAGQKCLPMPWTTTIPAGNYWIAINMRSTTGGANMSFGFRAASQWASTYSGWFGSASSASNQSAIGVGIYSATTAGLPSAISLTQILGNSSAFQRQPLVMFVSTPI